MAPGMIMATEEASTTPALFVGTIPAYRRNREVPIALTTKPSQVIPYLTAARPTRSITNKQEL
jgi:hypothetical protein